MAPIHCASGKFPLTKRLKVILDKYHWMLYYLVPAMYPRFMITLDEDLKSLPVTVRVGQVCRDPLFAPFFSSLNRLV